MAAFREANVYIRHLFRHDATWLSAAKEEIQVTKVLLRQPQYAVIECYRGDSTSCIMKVTNEVLAHMSTWESRKLFTWKLCGRDQFGLVLPNKEDDVPDLFLLHEEPQLPPGCSDPTYRPLPDHFEPWAQYFASYEQNAGYGRILDDGALGEPWCEHFTVQNNIAWRESATTTTSPVGSVTVDSVDRSQQWYCVNQMPQDSAMTSSPTCTVDDAYECMFCEPWAVGYTPYTARSISIQAAVDDQFHEPWSAHLVPAETRLRPTQGFNVIQVSLCHIVLVHGSRTSADSNLHHHALVESPDS